MTPDVLFAATSQLAMVTWVLMMLFPRRPFITTILAGIVTPVVLAVVYVVIILSWWWSADGGFSSLGEVATLFDNPWLLLAGWVHYLAFDLLVGRWELRDAQTRGVPYYLVVPCLVLTFMFGPGGWLLYCVIRTWAGRAR
jgi:hypothetical protein